VSAGRLAAVLVSLASALLTTPARGQACCAGVSAITPGRLELHERALVGSQLRVSRSLGSYTTAGRYRANAEGAAELDFQQDLITSWRWLSRGQATLVVPLMLSWRRSATTGAEAGGGVGDLNASGRYDIVRNREVSYLPGIGVLVGVTLPTGRPPDDAKKPLGSDATGVGAVQLSAGLALERSFGKLLLSLTGLAAKRLSRELGDLRSELGAQLSAIGGASYALSDALAAAFIVTYTYEGDARVDGRRAPDTARRQLRCALGGSAGVGDDWRLHGNIFLDPPLSGAGRNQPAAIGVTFGGVWSLL
jgi:hypothetical protein